MMTREKALKMAYAKRKNTAGEEREFLNAVIKVIEKEILREIGLEYEEEDIIDEINKDPSMIEERW